MNKPNIPLIGIDSQNGLTCDERNIKLSNCGNDAKRFENFARINRRLVGGVRANSELEKVAKSLNN